MQHGDDLVERNAEFDARGFDEERRQASRAFLAPAFLEDASDQGQEVVRAHRLRQERAGARFQACLRALLLGGDDDHRDAGELRVGAHAREHFVAVHLWHGKVEKHGRRLELLDLEQRVAAVHRRRHLVVPRERRLLESEDGFAVVDEEKVREAHAPFPAERASSMATNTVRATFLTSRKRAQSGCGEILPVTTILLPHSRRRGCASGAGRR